MKTRILICIISFVVLLSGCSRTKTISILADKWDTGQHRSCFYGHEHIYCFDAAKDEVAQRLPPLNIAQIKQYKDEGYPSLIEMEVLTPTALESRRKEAQESKGDSGTYETKFSSSPADYTMWDCYKTGLGAPAIQCTIAYKPTHEEIAIESGVEKGQVEDNEKNPRVDAFLHTLTADKLISLCGAPAVIMQDKAALHYISSPEFEKYLKLRDDTKKILGYKELDGKFRDIAYPVQGGYARDFDFSGYPNNGYRGSRSEFLNSVGGWHSWRGNFPNAAILNVKNLPCIMNQIK